ncbi:cation-transporting P-type ATPase [Mucilaginibacter sp. UYCu711]|uniref:cation-transporting P-type ATPase n=1 Tax=Mucilaginibacter sp. UYCu711 TaxID=3156339 RepID=UPI003D206C81
MCLRSVTGNGSNNTNSTEAAVRFKQFGIHTLKTTANSSGFLLLLSQFKSPITIMLIVAAILSAALGDVLNTVIILTIGLISSLLGFRQERVPPLL